MYKPHKKFRRHNSSFSKDECPTSSTQHHHLPEPQGRPTLGSLLASQLSEPPAGVSQQRAGPPAPSLLASTLSQGIPLASEESKRNEILAQLILDGNRGPAHQSGRGPAPQQPPNKPQGLLMCAWEPPRPQSQPQSSEARHIPVAALPTKPASARAMTSGVPSSTVTSGELLQSMAAAGQPMGQPLNLSKSADVMGEATPMGGAPTTQRSSGENSIPTKA